MTEIEVQPEQFPFVLLAVSSGNGRGSTTLIDALYAALQKKKLRAVRISCLAQADGVLQGMGQTKSAFSLWRAKNSVRKYALRNMRYNIADALRVGVSQMIGMNTMRHQFEQLQEIVERDDTPFDVVLIDDVRYYADYAQLVLWGAHVVRIEMSKPNGENDLYAKFADETGRESTELSPKEEDKVLWSHMLTKRRKPDKWAKDVLGELKIVRKARDLRKTKKDTPVAACCDPEE